MRRDRAEQNLKIHDYACFEIFDRVRRNDGDGFAADEYRRYPHHHHPLPLTTHTPTHIRYIDITWRESTIQNMTSLDSPELQHDGVRLSPQRDAR